MQLMLHYRGSLKSNGDPIHKHELRKHFHSQLAQLWSQKPLNEQPNLLKPRNPAIGDYCLLRPLGSFNFVPLISEEMSVICELFVTLLRPEQPGGIITQGGDIDNRIKTLLDSLTIPRHLNALPATAIPIEPHFFCLLEDDNLVTNLNVRTEQLLEPISDPSVVDLFIQVHTRITRPTFGNLSFA